MHTVKHILASAIFTAGLVVSGVCSAQPTEKLSFRGVPMGITEAEFKEKFPYFLCSNQDASALADRSCAAAGLKGEDANYGGASVEFVLASFLGDSLWLLSITFPSQDTSTLISALTDRYGKPAKIQESSVQNRAGASFDQIEATWAFSDGELSIRKRAGKVTEGRVDLRTSDGMAQVKNRVQEQKKSNASKL